VPNPFCRKDWGVVALPQEEVLNDYRKKKAFCFRLAVRPGKRSCIQNLLTPAETNTFPLSIKKCQERRVSRKRQSSGHTMDQDAYVQRHQRARVKASASLLVGESRSPLA
jgi:hypothetical protein